MKNQQNKGVTGYFSDLEYQVINAITMLPVGYEVLQEACRFDCVDEVSGNVFSYRPDLHIRNRSGMSVIVELKSERAMTLSNMNNFLAIDTALRHRQDIKFLVVVWRGERSGSRFSSFREFEMLHIVCAESVSEIVDSIEGAFQDFRRW